MVNFTLENKNIRYQKQSISSSWNISSYNNHILLSQNRKNNHKKLKQDPFKQKHLGMAEL